MSMQKNLPERVSRDTHLGYTSVGIHRDDIFVGANGKDIIEFGSQGQKEAQSLLSNFTIQIHPEPNWWSSNTINWWRYPQSLMLNAENTLWILLLDCGQAFLQPPTQVQDYLET